MNIIINDISQNFPLVAAFWAWFIAQIIKFTTEFIQNRKINFEKLIASGGMPSSHSSAVCALTTAVGITEGISSTYFAISLVLSLIVMYDAMGVRRETGKHSTILNKLIEDLLDYKPEYFQKNLKELIGHTPFQVLCGAILGIIVPYIMMLML